MSTNPNKQEKIYYIRYRKTGKQIEEKAGRQFKDDMTPAKASAIRAERIRGHQLTNKERREAEKEKKNNWTFDNLWKEYKKQKGTDYKGLRPDQNRFDKYIKPFFGKKEPKKVAPLDVDRLRLNALKGKSPQTQKLVLALLRRIANFGARKSLCQPLSFQIEMPKVDNIKTEDLTPDQLKELLKVIEADTHPQAGNLMLMALYTGMRRSELFRLQWEEVDFQRGFINILHPKGGKSQPIPLNESTRELLKSIKKEKGSPFVFPGRKGGQRTDIHRYVNTIRDAAGLPKDFRSLHGLRHVYASMLASSGEVDLYTLQKLLTHKSPEMTQRYAHLRDEALKKASGVASSILSDTMKTVKNEKKESNKDTAELKK